MDYLARQIETMARDMEEQLGLQIQPEKLKESLRIENETRSELRVFMNWLSALLSGGNYSPVIYDDGNSPFNGNAEIS